MKLKSVVISSLLVTSVFSVAVFGAEDSTREEKLREREISLPARTVQLEEWKNELDRQTDELALLQQNIEKRANQIPIKELQIAEQENNLNKRKEALDAVAKSLEERSQEFPLREIELTEQKNDLDRRSEEIAQLEAGFSKQQDYVKKSVAELNARAEELENARKIIVENNARVNSNATKIAQRQKEFNEQVRIFTENKKDFETRLAETKALEKKITALSNDLGVKLANQKDNEAMKTELDDLIRERDSVKRELADKRSELSEMSEALKQQRELLTQSREKLVEAGNTIKVLEAKVSSLNSEIEGYKQAALSESKRADSLEKLFNSQQTELASVRKQLDDALKILMPYAQVAQIQSDVPVKINTTVTQTENTTMNWSENYMEGTGMAVVPTQYKGTAQGVALARRGAILDLQRNLLEAMKGVNINAKTTMEDFMATDSVRSAVEGTIKGVEIYEGTQKGETYVVKGRIRLDKIHDEAAKKLSKSEPERDPVEYSPRSRRGKKSRQRVVRSGDFSGLIVDARHLPVQPSMFTRILDEEGRPVYGVNFGNRDIQNQSGLYVWYNKMVYARDEHRVGRRPLVVKAQRLSNGRNDIVIPNYAAKLVRDNTYNFRRDCKVIIVKD